MLKNFEKEYKESIGRAKKILGNCGEPIDTNVKEAIEAIFPILKMDKPVISREVIREGVAHFGITQYQIDNWLKKHFDIIDQDPCMEMKLNEQEKVNCNAGPMFHEGEWLCANKPNNYAHLVKIIKVVDVFGKERYKVSRDYDSDLDVVEYDFIEKNYHPWTIADAKDGDVLACENGWTCIFKILVNDETFSSYCFMDNTKWFCETGSECHTLREEFVKAYNGKIHPATKEQRNTLEKAMTNAGYTFDFEKKELKEIEQKSYGQRKECLDCQFNYAGECKGSCQMKRDKQKLAWSEEDERLCLCLIKDQKEALDEVRDDKYGHSEIISDLKEMYRERIDWLKSLEQRIGE
jgi:radical SAM protein with 4Fe4S-binding SPASM domain